MADNDTIEWNDDELLERLDGFGSDSPYEENLIMSARARLRQLMTELARKEEELNVYYVNCQCEID